MAKRQEGVTSLIGFIFKVISLALFEISLIAYRLIYLKVGNTIASFSD